MTRKDFAALAAILRDHREELQEVEQTSGKTNAVAFSRLVSDVRSFCKEHNPNFDGARFTDAVFGTEEN